MPISTLIHGRSVFCEASLVAFLPVPGAGFDQSNGQDGPAGCIRRYRLKHAAVMMLSMTGKPRQRYACKCENRMFYDVEVTKESRGSAA